MAVRKAGGLIVAGARRIRCISPTFHADLPPAVERIAEEYAERHLDGVGLVFAATNSAQVNEKVVQDARRRGIWVNRADNNDAEPGDFSTPAKLQRGPVVISVSAGSAALAAAIRDDLAERLDPKFVLMADAMTILRPEIIASGLDSARRAQVFRDLAGAEAINVLATGGLNSLRTWISQKYPELKR